MPLQPKTSKKKLKKIPIPLQTEKAEVVVDAEVPAALLENKSVPATTTAQEDLVTYRQSRINLIWEITQGLIAIFLVSTLCYSMVVGIEVKNEFWLLAGIVVQSYFQRTNHTRIGGIGYKPPGESR